MPVVGGPNQHGEPIELAALDSAYLLVFFPYAFTGICTGELAALRDSSAVFAQHGVRLIACSTDSMFAQRVFAETESFDFDLVSDHWPHGSIAEAFGVFDAERGCALRGSFAVDLTGVVRWRVVNGLGDARSVEDALTAAADLALLDAS